MFYLERNILRKPLKIWNRTSTHTNVQDTILGTYLSEAIRTVNKMDKSLGIKHVSMSLKYKYDFPLKISSGNGKVSTHALIAPRILEGEQQKQINKIMMDNIKKTIKIFNIILISI